VENEANVLALRLFFHPQPVYTLNHDPTRWLPSIPDSSITCFGQCCIDRLNPPTLNFRRPPGSTIYARFLNGNQARRNGHSSECPLLRRPENGHRASACYDLGEAADADIHERQGLSMIHGAVAAGCGSARRSGLTRKWR
jgi:hypothetical protein